MPPVTASPSIKQPLVRRLPGLLSQARHSLGRIWRRLAWPPPPATVLHVTHYKAGSQWVRRILEELAQPWIVVPRADSSQFLAEPIVGTAVYPTLYLTREQVESVSLPANSRRFVIIRDLRDTLISAYFSLKVSHKPVTSHMTDYRAMLTTTGSGGGPDQDDPAGLHTHRRDPDVRGWAGRTKCSSTRTFSLRDEEILARVLLDQCRSPGEPRSISAGDRREPIRGPDRRPQAGSGGPRLARAQGRSGRLEEPLHRSGREGVQGALRRTPRRDRLRTR